MYNGPGPKIRDVLLRIEKAHACITKPGFDVDDVEDAIRQLECALLYKNWLLGYYEGQEEARQWLKGEN